MPGHVAKTTGPDPDPDPWLVVSDELHAKLKAKPYDAKKSCWVPEKATGGYNEGLIENTDGEKITVKILGTNEVSYRKYYYHTLLAKFRICGYILKTVNAP